MTFTICRNRSVLLVVLATGVTRDFVIKIIPPAKNEIKKTQKKFPPARNEIWGFSKAVSKPKRYQFAIYVIAMDCYLFLFRLRRHRCGWGCAHPLASSRRHICASCCWITLTTSIPTTDNSTTDNIATSTTLSIMPKQKLFDDKKPKASMQSTAMTTAQAAHVLCGAGCIATSAPRPAVCVACTISHVYIIYASACGCGIYMYIYSYTISSHQPTRVPLYNVYVESYKPPPLKNEIWSLFRNSPHPQTKSEAYLEIPPH